MTTTDPHNSFAKAMKGLKDYWFLVLLVGTLVVQFVDARAERAQAVRERAAIKAQAALDRSALKAQLDRMESKQEAMANAVTALKADSTLIRYRLQQLEKEDGG